MVKTFERISENEELCNYCEFTRDGYSVNTSEFNLCYGNRCEEAYEKYLEGCEEELLELREGLK